MAQADRILLVIDARDREPHGEMIAALKSSGARAPVDLVVVRAEGSAAPDVLDWRQRTGAGAHYYVRPDRDDAFASLARQLPGRGVGPVLAGGGAPGFPHLGRLQVR